MQAGTVVADGDGGSVAIVSTPSAISAVEQTARYETPTELSATEKLRRRLNTFKQWTSKKSSLQLATAGFVYTGITDKVECQACGIRLYNWQEDEDPIQSHKKYAPDCEFMKENFPNVQAGPKPPRVLAVKYEHYKDYATRLQTFDSWPLKCVAQKPEMMARSGFFYIGSADRARCFHCGVTLRDWDSDDYPPCVHKQWSENCPFVQQLDVDSMKEEIEEWERDEQRRIEFENSNFIDCSSSQAKQTLVSSCSDDVEIDGASAPRATSSTDRCNIISQASETSDAFETNTAVMAVLDMGVERDLIRKAIDIRHRDGDGDFPSAVSLYEAVLALEENGG